MKRMAFVASILMIMACAAQAMDAQKIVEIRAEGSESLLAFLKRLPGSFEAQVFYGLFGSGIAGAMASWAWKWSKGQAGVGHFSVQYVASQVLWLAGSSIAAILTVGFSTEQGVFFGWLSVLWTGALAGFGGEVKVDREQWTPEQRAAEAVKP